MSTPRFDLVDITQTLNSRKRLLLIVSVVAAVLGGIFYTVSKKEYKAQASFLMSNPLYSDKGNIFQEQQIAFVDYFGGDDDVDHLMTVIESDSIKYLVADRLNLAAAYKLDMSKPKNVEKLKNMFKDNYKVTRTEYNNCVISYTDTDPQRAADVVNATVKAVEETFRSYYVQQRRRVITAVESKVGDLDSTIVVMSDSLAAMRNHYKIYDILSPGREGVSGGSIKSNGSADFGKGVELIQNYESIKDQTVRDRAQYTSILNKLHTTAKNDDVPLLHSLMTARVPVKPKPPGLILTVISCGLIGFFCTSLYILITSYYRVLIAVER
jgi:LPS O-antigen subunit length determinant protein (WzzB/FepE family)